MDIPGKGLNSGFRERRSEGGEMIRARCLKPARRLEVRIVRLLRSVVRIWGLSLSCQMIVASVRSRIMDAWS